MYAIQLECIKEPWLIVLQGLHHQLKSLCLLKITNEMKGTWLTIPRWAVNHEFRHKRSSTRLEMCIEKWYIHQQDFSKKSIHNAEDGKLWICLLCLCAWSSKYCLHLWNYSIRNVRSSEKQLPLEQGSWQCRGHQNSKRPALLASPSLRKILVLSPLWSQEGECLWAHCF